MRARLALCQAGVPVELREVDLKRKPAALLALSPAATVPVLDVEPGTVLVQSLDILRWALAQRDTEHWLTRGDSAFNQWLVHTNDGDFKQALDRYKYANRHPQRTQADYREDAVRLLIAPLEAKLGQGRFVGGDGPCWADVAVFPFVRQFAAVDAAWWDSSPWTTTRHWLRGWQDSPLFSDCMSKQAVWTPGDTPVRFPRRGRAPVAVIRGAWPTVRGLFRACEVRPEALPSLLQKTSVLPDS